jgi:hypothetical protein
MSRALITVGILLCLVQLTGCNLLAKWRDSQIQTSHTAAQQGGPVLPPATPITIPSGVLATLPLDQSFTFTDYSKQGDDVIVKAISAWDAATTANWMLARLAQLGYDSGDNPSRILEGCDYLGNSESKYKSIRVKVTLNSSDQCLVQISTAN